MVSVEEIKKIIVSQREEIEETLRTGNIIERELEKKHLERHLRHPNILVVTGIRRCGKSTLSWRILKNRKFGYINFDDERLYGMEPEDLDKVLEALYSLYGTNLEYIVLDEVQNVDGWELFANRLRRTKKLIITGSNSNLLSGELATHLTGRYIDVTLFPFGFREFLLFSGFLFAERDVYSTKKKSELIKLLEQYIKRGGFPEAYTIGTMAPLKIYGDIINKDVIQRYKIRYRKALRDIAKYFVSNASSEITYSKLQSICGIKDVHTIKNYVSYLESSYLVFILERFSFKLKEQMIAPKKVYCIDTGIINAVGFASSENRGRLLENAVFLELARKEKEVYYWKDHQHNEVDFVVKSAKKVGQLIQVTYASSRTEINKREIASLLKASKTLKCDNLIVITWDYEDSQKLDNKIIEFKPLWKWLLGHK